MLVLAAVLAGFWFWYRVPNVRVPDEFSRVLDPLAAITYTVAEPSLESLRDGVTQGRTLGATFYLTALAHVPALLVLAARGEFDTLESLIHLQSRWEVWNALPEWYWTTTILTARVFNLVLAVGCVYLVYRFGTAMRDRQTGQLAAVFLIVSYGFLDAAHEAGEDVPALFCLLLVLCLAHYYAETGDRAAFLAGCVFGGLGIAFKLTNGTTVFVLAVAFLLYARNADNPRDALVAPRLLGAGAALGAAAVLIGFPSVLVAGLNPLFERLVSSVAEKTVAPAASVPSRSLWFWVRKGYRGGLGLPLVAATSIGVLAALPQVRKHSPEADGTIMVFVTLAVCAVAFTQWKYVKISHLLPTFALLMLPIAAALSRLDVGQPWFTRALVAVLVATSGVYAVAGVSQFANDPRDAATAWIEHEVPENATIAVSVSRSSASAIPHGRAVVDYTPTAVDTAFDRQYIRNYAMYYRWKQATVENRPDYIEGWRLANGHRDEYVIAAKFERHQPLRRLTTFLGGGRYPEQRRTVVVFERRDRCPLSPTCSTNRSR